MTREKALSQVAPSLSYFNDCKPAFAIEECKRWINKIYDDFENKSCQKCKHYDGSHKCNNENSIACGTSNRVYPDDYCKGFESHGIS